MNAKIEEDKGKFIPEFRPTNIQVILDEGVEEMLGNYISLMIKDVIYGTNHIRIIVQDYRK